MHKSRIDHIIAGSWYPGRFRCTMGVDCGQLDPGAVIQPVPGEWHPHYIPERLDEEELADWRVGRNALRIGTARRRRIAAFGRRENLVQLPADHAPGFDHRH